MMPTSTVKLAQHPGCDKIQNTLEIIGDKWTGLIVRDLSVKSARFSELELSLEGISPRTLSQRLDKLEREEIIIKRLYCEHPPRYIYELTRKGRELEEIIVKMADWGARYECASKSSNS